MTHEGPTTMADLSLLPAESSLLCPIDLRRHCGFCFVVIARFPGHRGAGSAAAHGSAFRASFPSPALGSVWAPEGPWGGAL